MKIFKKIGFLALFLAFVMTVTSVFNGMPITRKIKVRTIDAESIATLSYDERARQELEQFDEYEIYEQQNGNIIKFVGTRSYSSGEFTDCDYIGLNDEDVNVTYNLSCDTNTSEVTVEITYKQNDEVLNVDYISIPKINYQEDGNAIIYFEDGTTINSNDYLSEEPLDHCAVVIAAAAAGTATVLIEIVTFVLVSVIVYYIFSWLFPWRSRPTTSYRYEKKTTYKQQTYAVPAVTINGIRYEAKPKTKAEIEALPHQKEYGDTPNYYLAFASGIAVEGEIKDTSLNSDGLFIGPQINYEQAKSILTNPTYTQVEINKVTYNYVVSVYTRWQSDITALMNDPLVGYSTRTPFNKPEKHNGGLLHYHPMDIYVVKLPFKKANGKVYTKDYQPHAFFLINNYTGVRSR